MKINDEGLELIKSFEGCRLVAYKCPADVWTIGYGHTAGVYEGMVITQQQANNMLKSDMRKYEKYVTDNVKIPLNENQFSALVSFCYNCGVGNLKKLVKNRTAAQIADAMLLYNKASDKVLTGLVRRRKAERDLFLKGVAGTDQAKKSNEEVAKEVLKGKWGNGTDRKNRLSQAGYDYKVIQSIVNKLLRA